MTQDKSTLPALTSVIEKSAGGRPPKAEADRTVVATVRLTRARKEHLRTFGAAWLADAIDDEAARRLGQKPQARVKEKDRLRGGL